jgi:hypothetical protein
MTEKADKFVSVVRWQKCQVFLQDTVRAEKLQGRHDFP